MFNTGSTPNLIIFLLYEFNSVPSLLAISNTKSFFFWDNEIVDATTQSLKNYPITGYWPQKIGINISILFTDKILYSFYAGRLFNLFVCSLIIFVCLKFFVCITLLSLTIITAISLFFNITN